jgi:hypothetical protein
MVISVRDVQPSKHLSPMDVRLSGSLIFVIDRQPEKADAPILFSVSGRLMFLSFPQPEKAEFATAVIFWLPTFSYTVR